ncbi:MAG: hypothetical protein ACHQVS_01095 [Candidatus Babeliales bacterium]
MYITPDETRKFDFGSPVSVHLVVGPREDAHEHIKDYFMRLFCKKNACATCSICHAIKDEQYHAATWIKPKDSYVLDDLDPIFSTISFALEEDQKHFFVITKADFLSPQCANRLLKVLEEPPHNYYFILLAERSKNILPTIKSRCIKSSVIAGLSSVYHPTLAAFFIKQNPINPSSFLKELDQTKINDQETLDLLDHLLDHWSEQAHTAIDEHTMHAYTYAQQMVYIITQGLLHAPMPGSSSLFWKNFMLEVQELRKRKL